VRTKTAGSAMFRDRMVVREPVGRARLELDSDRVRAGARNGEPPGAC